MNKYRILSIFVILAMLFSFANISQVAATSPNPLDDGGWELVAHMSNSGGMFDGNGELAPTYSYGTFVANPVASTPDFQREFPVDADKILFITGDGAIWAIADYGDMRALIDARAGVFPPNLTFETSVNGVISNTTGNVLSRSGAVEDPWISIDGGHFDGINNQRIVWGENNYGAGTHQALKNNHGGINVYVKAAGNQPVLVPTNLCAGDQYRLVFITDDTISSGVYHNQTLWSNIETYNDFVTTQANSVLELSELGTTWKVIGSTTSVSARVNTGTDPSTTGVPIYSVANTLIAENNADLWDGSIANPIEMTQTGVLLPAGTQIITGTHFDGLQSYHSKYGWATFGSDGTGYGIRISFGLSGNIDTTWINNLWYPFSAPIYAMSGVLTVPIDAVEGAGCDSELPTAAATQSPDANGLGWNNTDVTVTWTWSDEVGGSGIDNAACTTSSTSTGEGELTLTATCKDLAGNEGSASYTVKVDQTLPVADAGSDQSIHAGYTVNLDGGASSDDNTLPEELSYNWSFDSTPAGNTATLNNADTATPSFTPNVSGEYVAQLIVTDDADNASEPVLVTLSSLNMAPAGDATATPMLPILGQAVSLDGSASNDPDGDTISYQWTVTSKPVGSAASLTNATSVTASITPDVSGEYVLTLTVSDFLEAGTPVTVSFVASTAEEFSQMQIINVSTVVVTLEPAEITTAGNQEAFGNFLTNTMSQIQKGNLNKAIADLERAIARTDGCALRGSPDGNGPGMDWVTTCDAQASIYNSLVEALQVLLD
jgi:hypothetical protein